MTQLTYVSTEHYSEFLVDNDGRQARISLHRFYALSPDADLHETASRAIAQPGVPVVVPSTCNVPKPRHSKVYGVRF